MAHQTTSYDPGMRPFNKDLNLPDKEPSYQAPDASNPNILATWKCKNDRKGWIVLHVNRHNKHTPYIVHYWNGETSSYCHGDYYDSLGKAQKGFCERIKNK